MNLVYVITRADAVGGATIHVRDLAREMIARGHQVTVLVGGEGPVTRQLAAAGVPYQSLRHLRRSIHPVRDLLAVREMVSALRQLRPELVSAHTAKAGLVARAACARLRVPAIYTPHGWTIGSRISPLAGPLFGLVERLAARWSAAIVCVCDAERRLALENGIGPPNRLRLIYNGMPDIAMDMRADPTGEPVRILCVARMEAPKDHQTLFEALAALRWHSWNLELVGDGPLELKLRVLAEALNIDDRIEWAGYLPDPAPALEKAQLFVLASCSEAFPRSILEAMRAGLPVVATDVGGVREAVAEDESGILVPANDPEAMANALDLLLTSGALRQRMGEMGRHIFEERFRFERMADETAALYSERCRGG
ncbi:MAG: glycosyltransferase family 4 protein [Bryobacterales bacterium]|nr:glycosyltransferase family 4 protein [Bryobacterales bacterium]